MVLGWKEYPKSVFEFAVIISSISVFTHLTDEEERLMRFLNFSRTTVSKEMVPSQPQPTANSPHEPPTTAAESQDTPTTMKDTKKTTFIFPEGDKKVEYCISLYTYLYHWVRKIYDSGPDIDH